MTTVFQYVNDKLRDRSPSQIVCLTLAAVAAAHVVNNMFNDGQLPKRGKKAVWRGIRRVAAPIIRREVVKAAALMKTNAKEGLPSSKVLPEHGKSREEVMQDVNTLHNELDQPYHTGMFSGAVYHGGEEHTKFVNDVMALFQWSNPLHSDIFGATRQMEAEIVSMVVHMYNGHLLPDACGAVTSGGTESILMAMRTYRAWARADRGIERPSVVAPITIHPGFDKAAEYFDIELIKVPVDPVTRRVDPATMERHIRYDTIALAASAPNFPHGVVDDIEALAEVAYRHNIGMHVDCCLGGFIMPFLEKTGRKAPIVDFRNRGVTSITCDTHKYGYAPKGTSTVMYRTKELRSHQFCCVAEWPGGMYCSPAVSGSKPGNVIAGTWAAMVNMGVDGYVEACDKIMTARETMTSELQKMPHMEIIGDPTASVFAFTSHTLDIFRIGDEMSKRGWVLNRLQFPSGLQFSVTLLQTNPGVTTRFINDVREISISLDIERQQALAEGKKMKIGDSSPTMYGTAQRIPDRSIIQDVLREYLSAYYTP